MNKKLIEMLKVTFLSRIERKTGWGKKEIETIFCESIIEVMAQLLDEQET